MASAISQDGTLTLLIPPAHRNKVCNQVADGMMVITNPIFAVGKNDEHVTEDGQCGFGIIALLSANELSGASAMKFLETHVAEIPLAGFGFGVKADGTPSQP